MEQVNRGGQSFFVPSNKDQSLISSFGKWEQAFRIFMNVYTKQYPERASELIQYNHIIFTASTSYVWDNVYTYDHEFHMHMGRFPSRNWAVILQQAWTMYLKDRLRYNDSNRQQSYHKHRKEECKRFNKGKCTAGMGCRFDHRCLECGKFGHGAKWSE